MVWLQSQLIKNCDSSGDGGFIYLFIEIYASSGPYSSEQVSPVKSSVKGK